MSRFSHLLSNFAHGLFTLPLIIPRQHHHHLPPVSRLSYLLSNLAHGLFTRPLIIPRQHHHHLSPLIIRVSTCLRLHKCARSTTSIASILVRSQQTQKMVIQLSPAHHSPSLHLCRRTFLFVRTYGVSLSPFPCIFLTPTTIPFVGVHAFTQVLKSLWNPWQQRRRWSWWSQILPLPPLPAPASLYITSVLLIKKSFIACANRNECFNMWFKLMFEADFGGKSSRFFPLYLLGFWVWN